MASITTKNTRRYRIQFTMRRELYESYQTQLARAQKLQLVIDFARDFEEWFENQIRQVEQDMGKFETAQTDDKQELGRSLDCGNLSHSCPSDDTD